MADPFAEPERLTVADAFQRHAGIDLLATSAAGRRSRPRAGSRQSGRASGIRVSADDTWSDIFSQVMVEKIEPHLGLGRATILYRIPGERGGAGAAASPPIRASPNASSSMPAASSLPMPSAS